MKAKAYITPESTIKTMAGEQIICASITDIVGDADIEMGDENDPIPEEADSRRYSIWDDEDEW